MTIAFLVENAAIKNVELACCSSSRCKNWLDIICDHCDVFLVRCIFEIIFLVGEISGDYDIMISSRVEAKIKTAIIDQDFRYGLWKVSNVVVVSVDKREIDLSVACRIATAIPMRSNTW